MNKENKKVIISAIIAISAFLAIVISSKVVSSDEQAKDTNTCINMIK